jgi:hypothetical protein
MVHARRIPWLAIGFVLVLNLSGPAIGSPDREQDKDEIRTCRDENGDITFQDDPCPELPKRKPLPPPEPEAPKKKSRSAAAPKQPDDADPFESRAGNRSWTIAPAPSEPPVRNFGKQTFPTRHDAADTPANPSFASPAETWRTFLAAVESGDGAAVAVCLTPTAIESLGSAVEVDALRRMLETFERIDNDGDLGPFWSIHGTRKNGPPKWIFIEEIAVGVWKISWI